MSDDARAIVLARIRAALSDAPADVAPPARATSATAPRPDVAPPARATSATAPRPDVAPPAGATDTTALRPDVAPPARATSATAPRPDLAARFAERVAAYRATVTTCAEDEVAAVVGAICARHGARRLAVPPGLPAAWAPAGVELLRDAPPLSVGALDAVDGVLTGARAGVAETGTIVLDGGVLCGRRALTLIPDLHVCVVRAVDLGADVPDMIGVLGEAARAGRPVTLVSGPSATSDIEFDRVEGVHGPRRLEVVLV